MAPVSVSLGARAGRRRAAAALLAVAAHALFIAVLVWQAHPWVGDVLGPGQVIDVRLAPRLMPPQSKYSRHPPAQALAAPSTRPSPARPPTETQAPAAPVPQSPARPETPGSAPDATGGDVGKALRAAFGCNVAALANLTPDERQRCQDRFTPNRQGALAREFGVDPGKRAYFDANAKRALWWQEPFLATTPKNGCAPKITNQQFAVAGGSRTASDWRVGISCGKAF